MRSLLNITTIITGLILSSILILPATSQAEIAATEEMELACRNWLTYMTFQKGDWAGSAEPEISDMIEITDDNSRVLGHYYPIEPSGFIVVPILKDLPPIKAYSDQFRLDFSEPEGMAALIRDVLTHRLNQFEVIYGDLNAIQPDKGPTLLGREHRDQWNFLSRDEESFKKTLADKDVTGIQDEGPLLTSIWDQSAPYNNFCPMGDGGRTVVGCVATATAQIMAYHDWPPEGTGYHSYYWPGDGSCNGSSPGSLQEADYTDSYDWDNIPDNCGGGCDYDEEQALAELCYEVGVAFNMSYGYCGSGAYTSDAQYVFPTYFRYKNTTAKVDRNDYSSHIFWSDLIKTEIEASRPIQYRISGHSIVCDGWRVAESINQVHMNYGWGGGSNAWCTIDNLYCPWEGCSPLVEYMIIGIEPDRGVEIDADQTMGDVPFTIQFTGSSTLDVDEWIWAFGDGDSSFIQSPLHTYTESGRYDVTLKVVAGLQEQTYSATNYIAAMADSVVSIGTSGEPDEIVEVVINGSNTFPIDQIKLPVEYSGTLNLTLDTFLTDGCRTDYFDVKTAVHVNPHGKQVCLSFYNINPGTPDLEAGAGPIVKLYFKIPAGATADQTAQIILDGYSSHVPMFYGPILDYIPVNKAGTVSLPFLCGDTNGDKDINLTDILNLISYVYGDPPGPAPDPLLAGDVNADTDINLSDILYLIAFVYNEPPGPDPICL